MKRVMPIFLCCSLVLATAASLSARGPKAAGVQSAGQAFAKALLAGDAQALAALYSDGSDDVLVMPGAPAARGVSRKSRSLSGGHDVNY